jgi:adenylylsulfate kinase
MRGFALWITGLPGSGKSTVAAAVRILFPDFVILRMDDLRKIVTPEPTYSEYERDMVYRCLVYLAKEISDLGHRVIIDATGNRRKWRELARQLMPEYAEIYLKCSHQVCSEREKQRDERYGAPGDIYIKGEEGWPVPGMNVPYEEPVNPDLIINSERASIEESVSLIDDFLKKRL